MSDKRAETAFERPLCACDCGNRVKSPEGRFLRGHSGRDPAIKAKIGAARRTGELRMCTICGTEEWVPPYKLATWRCKRLCFAESKRKHGAWNPLQERCLRWMKEHAASRSVLARTAGIGGWTLETWFAKQGSAPTRRVLEALAAVLEISPEQAIVEAGGKTAQDVWRDTGRLNGLVKHSGWRKPREELDRMVATKRANGLFESEAFKLSKISRSLSMQVVKALSAYLMQHPQPTAQQLRQLAVRVAAKRGLSVASVTGLWRPYVRRRGLRVQAGRPAMATQLKTTRASTIGNLRASWPRTEVGDLVDGFWSAALSAVRDSEGAKAPSSKESLRQWWLDHSETGA